MSRPPRVLGTPESGAPEHGASGRDALATTPVSRRHFLHAAGAMGALAAVSRLTPAYAQVSSGHGPSSAARAGLARGARPVTVDLRVAQSAITIDGRRATAVAMNDTVPGPLLRFREGDEAIIRVTNALREDTSIHWHGIILPNAMDGVPGVNFAGIPAGTTFTYRYPLKQYGTYWYHSHSGLQEQLGHYGPMIIDPAEPEPFQYDREYVVMLSDWMFEDPERVLDRLKKQATYSNYQRRTAADFFRDVDRMGWRDAIRERWMWAQMRMSPTDISDVTAPVYTYLCNGLPPAANWTGLFRPGERVRLRFINAGAGSYFDVRIPGLPMTVVAVSGQYVQPVTVDEFRMEIAQTYDVIVEPREAAAYTIFAESMDRSGFARGTLAPRAGMEGPIPKRRPRPELTMTDMGMAMGAHGGHGGHGGMSGMGGQGTAGAGTPAVGPSVLQADTTGAHAGHVMPNTPVPAPTPAAGHAGHGASPPTGPAAGQPAGQQAGAMAGHAMGGMAMGGMAEPRPSAPGTRLYDGTIERKTGLRPLGTLPEPVLHGSDRHDLAMQRPAEVTKSRLAEPGPGLGEDGWRVLVYSDLRAITPFPESRRQPVRELELHLTGNMERYMWSINGVKFSDAPDALRLTQGEPVRFTLVNDTMMSHPMHIHGMWMLLENGHGELCPRLHTVNVKPAERVSFVTVPEDLGPWAFHCHVLYHMEMGMMRVFDVVPPSAGGAPVAAQEAR